VPKEGFEHVPPCTSADQAGCVESYQTFPAASPPADGSLFGRVRDTGAPALCVDPAALLGEDTVDVVLPTRLSLLGGVEGLGVAADADTPFVTLTDAVRISCAETGGYGYLAAELASPSDPRGLDHLLDERLGPTWGLHLLDANVDQHARIELVSQQAQAHG
jgi:hypothetical protein